MTAGSRLVPRMNELLAFEAAARHLSFTSAAVELSLTQGAVSRAIGELEGRLGVRLFERVRQRVVLTDAGRAYFGEVRGLLEQMSAATRRVMAAEPGGEVLNLAVLPTFATAWLVRHLPGFLAKFPHVTVNLGTRIRPFSFDEEPFDAAIHHGRPIWPGATTRHLMDESMLPMTSPAYRAAKALRRPADLRRATLLHQATRPSAWAQWHEQAGLPTRSVFRGPTYDQFAMVAGAAAAGIGVALLPNFLVEQPLSEGKLELLFAVPLSTASAYYVVLPEKGAKRIAREFADWAAESLRTACA
ncbi:MAG TPA: LysR substrate-binding domain-containing protein [Steroidobacteraceae bacterium]|nr:LysR substrate-binding domain-containing protein [Steroidobacteraceae bacterium]